jgi:hypothetical protein
MNDLNQHFTDADFDDDAIEEDPFDAEFRRREDEEGRDVDKYLDDAQDE